MNTVNVVAKQVRKKFGDNFTDLVLFDSQVDEKDKVKQINVYRDNIGKSLSVNIIPLNDDGTIPTEKMIDEFNLEGEKVVDLSNGPKLSTSSLYLAAALCRIENIYCLFFGASRNEISNSDIDDNYIKIQRPEQLNQFAKISYFDLIYYTEVINDLFSNEERGLDTKKGKCYHGLVTGIEQYFSSNVDQRDVINNVTIGDENLRNQLLDYTRNNKVAIDYCENVNENRKNSRKIDLYKENADPIGILTTFYKAYSADGTNKDLQQLITVPFLLSALRAYRNISAHYGNRSYQLNGDVARTVINMELEVLCCVHRNNELWEQLG
jgi:hypothetical protein